jgi:hypothetical protein
MDGAAAMELILRGVAIGALIATAAGLWRAGKGHSARLAGVLFSVSVLAYALQSSAESRLAIGPLEPIVHFLALGGSGLFWLFIVALFDDREISPEDARTVRWADTAGLAGLARPP